MDPAFSIPSFYSGKSVFITGATGFLGKALIEKLLRSCPDIKELFLLIRPKRDVSIHERLRQLLTNPFFDTLRQEQPYCFDKIILVEGDISLEDLGLSAEDRDILIEKTSVIFHMAAEVKFDNTLKDAILKNVRSTRDICDLGERMKHLVALVHVSSIFTQVDKYTIDEITYPTTVNWRKTIQMAETLNDDVLEVFKSKYIGTMPNHYVFTKKLAEKVIIDYSGSLPCVISRPSIVGSSLRDPVKGWCDNFNGAMGIIISVGIGILKVIYGDPIIRRNCLPIDIVTKSLIVAAWKRGARMTGTQDNLPYVYNCVAFNSTCLSTALQIQIGFNFAKDIPLDNIIWAPGVSIINNIFFYRLLVLLFHLIPALFIDKLLQLSGRQPRLLKMHKSIFRTNYVLSYFARNEWKMRNRKFLSLSDEVPVDDQRDFGYVADMIYDQTTYFMNTIIGSKIYLLKESMDRLDAAKSHYNRMLWIDRIVKALFGIFLMWIIYRISYNL